VTDHMFGICLLFDILYYGICYLVYIVFSICLAVVFNLSSAVMAFKSQREWNLTKASSMSFVM